MTRIKICGLTRIEDIEAVNRSLPNYIGFVFAESRRKITPMQACGLKEHLDTQIKAVGIFVNEPVSFISELCREEIIDLVQLHGDEDRSFIRMLKETITCPVIKAVRVQNAEQILKAQELPCDMLLLDSFQPGIQGGSGRVLDRTIIPQLSKNFFLAGGLELGNVTKAIRDTKPYGIDISSGAETNGVKDPAKIHELITHIRGLE